MNDFIAPTVKPTLPACLTAEEHALALSLCGPVKGLGALSINPSLITSVTVSRDAAIRAAACTAASLPICDSGPINKPQPTPVITTEDPKPADEGSVLKQRGLLVGSLLFLVVGVGGYVTYRQLKKKPKRKGRR